MAVRHLTRLGAAGILATIALLIPVHAAAQAESGSRDGWTTPKTSWGDPDLQGVWTTDWERSVPFERSRELGERSALTTEEIAVRAKTEERALADDKETRRPSRSVGAAAEHWYEFGKQVSSRTSLVVDPPDGRIPPKTLGGQTRQIEPSPQTWQPSAYNNGFQIVQSPGYVALLFERLHEHRIIPLDGRPPLNSGIGQIFGDSRGHWDGDTLVVEVTNFSDETNYRGSGSTRHLIERYTRVDDGTVRVEVTIDDPATWTKPWTMVVNGKHDPDYWQIFEYACHEGNYGMRNILSAARNLEKAAEEGK